MTREQNGWIFAWFRTVPETDPAYRAHDNWIMDLAQLGVVDPHKGEMNDKRMEQCLAFIKTRIGQTPDYHKLLKHLRELDRAQVTQQKQVELARSKKIKNQRKKTKASRKRNRRK